MMTTIRPAIMAGALVLGVMTAANAAERAPLTDEQLDAITAGYSWGYQIWDGSILTVQSPPGFLTRQEAYRAGKADPRLDQGELVKVYGFHW
jgi:hypothetical protein